MRPPSRSSPPPRFCRRKSRPSRRLQHPQRSWLTRHATATSPWLSTPPSSSSASLTWPTLSPCTSTPSPGSSTCTCRWAPLLFSVCVCLSFGYVSVSLSFFSLLSLAVFYLNPVCAFMCALVHAQAHVCTYVCVLAHIHMHTLAHTHRYICA